MAEADAAARQLIECWIKDATTTPPTELLVANSQKPPSDNEAAAELFNRGVGRSAEHGVVRRHGDKLSAAEHPAGGTRIALGPVSSEVAVNITANGFRGLLSTLYTRRSGDRIAPQRRHKEATNRSRPVGESCLARSMAAAAGGASSSGAGDGSDDALDLGGLYDADGSDDAFEAGEAEGEGDDEEEEEMMEEEEDFRAAVLGGRAEDAGESDRQVCVEQHRMRMRTLLRQAVGGAEDGETRSLLTLGHRDVVLVVSSSLVALLAFRRAVLCAMRQPFLVLICTAILGPLLDTTAKEGGGIRLGLRGT